MYGAEAPIVRGNTCCAEGSGRVSGTDLLESVRDQGQDAAAASTRPAPWLELGLGLVVVAVPLAFVPASFAPFVDAKMVLLLAGSLAVWAGTRSHSRLTLPAAAWLGTLALAGLLGVDRWWSLTGPENTGNGLLLLGTSAFLLVAGTGVPPALRARIPAWLVGTATAVAAVSIVYRLWPGALNAVVPGLSFEGGTLGHPVFVAGLAAAGVAAAVGLARRAPWTVGMSVVILASALALSTKRVGWVALAVGLAVVLWRSRPPRRQVLLVVGLVAATLAAWTVVDAFTGPATPLSGARRFGELATDSAQSRVTAWKVLGRGWSHRPVLGWGPGNTWAAYTWSATQAEVEQGERGFRDAHNLLVEAAVTTGGGGLAALLVLVGFTVREARRGSPAVGWAAGSAAALGVVHLVQPLTISLTPLLFLLAGLACPPPEDHPDPPTEGPADAMARGGGRRAAGRTAVGIVLAAGLLLTVGLLASAVLERYGRSYNSQWALRQSLRLAPERATTAEALALSLALDGRSRDEAAAREAVALAERTVSRHPWNPRLRLIAADVHILLNDFAGARTWVERHLARFPRDRVPIPEEWSTAAPSPGP
jgi:O-antigen ligase